MNKQIRLIIAAAIVALIGISCTKNDGQLDSASLKLAIDQSVMNLNTAMDKISASNAYTVFTAADGGLKSATTDPEYKVYIGLDKISGVYEYKPVTKRDRWGFSLIRFFNRTGDNDNMIVSMPLKKVKNPMSLRHFSPADTALKNNFSISVSDYFNNYNSYWDYEYLIDSKISIDDKEAGSLYMKSLVSPELGRNYFSQYAFTEGYTTQYKYVSGDTTVSSFAILKDKSIVYEEKRITIKNDTAKFRREHTYILTIGNVSITRKHGWESAQIAVNGVVQPDAVIAVVDQEDDEEASVCNHREIQITFEDGTKTTISTLISDSVENIRTIYKSLHQVYFAAYVVDWIAYDIYYGRN